MRNSRHKLKRELGPSGHKKKCHLFDPKDSQAVEQDAQKGCAASILGGFQDLTG